MKTPASHLGPITAAKLLKKMKRATAQLGEVSRVEADRVRGPVTCRPGCAWCCYAKVLIGPWEALFIYLHLKASGRWTAELRARLVGADKDLTDHTHGQWLGKKIPCVFLAESEPGHGTCSVYNVRPAGCLSTFSNTADPQNCGLVGGSHIFAIIRFKRGPGVAAERQHQDLHRSVIPYVGELVSATIPGAVLRAEAIVEGLPMPEVHTLDLAIESAVSLEVRFDRAAKEPD